MNKMRSVSFQPTKARKIEYLETVNWKIVQKQTKSSVKSKLENLFQCANHWASTTLNIPSLVETTTTKQQIYDDSCLFCLYWPIANENCSCSCTQFCCRWEKKNLFDSPSDILFHSECIAIYYFFLSSAHFKMISISATAKKMENSVDVLNHSVELHCNKDNRIWIECARTKRNNDRLELMKFYLNEFRSIFPFIFHSRLWFPIDCV